MWNSVLSDVKQNLVPLPLRKAKREGFIKCQFTYFEFRLETGWVVREFFNFSWMNPLFKFKFNSWWESRSWGTMRHRTCKLHNNECRMPGRRWINDLSMCGRIRTSWRCLQWVHSLSVPKKKECMIHSLNRVEIHDEVVGLKDSIFSNRISHDRRSCPTNVELGPFSCKTKFSSIAF
jgi:hypothetical protein